MSRVEGGEGRVSRTLGGEEFSFTEAVGGWRGLVESVLPGLIFVVTYLAWGGFRVPVMASVGTVAVLVAARLAQRTPITQALSGAFGVALGALWAWRAGDAGEYFVPGFWITGAYLAAVLVSMLVRWPAVGLIMGLVRGWGGAWREHPALVRRFQVATGIYAVSQAIKLAVQLPLYFAGAVAALGTARLAMGLPYFALILWVLWLLVRNAELPQEPADQRPPQ
jgi:hypothetical protein